MRIALPYLLWRHPDTSDITDILDLEWFVCLCGNTGSANALSFLKEVGSLRTLFKYINRQNHNGISYPYMDILINRTLYISCQAGPRLNPGPSALKASVLPIELTWQTFAYSWCFKRVGPSMFADITVSVVERLLLFTADIAWLRIVLCGGRILRLLTRHCHILSQWSLFPWSSCVQ